MSATRKPWMKFYPADWRADQALRICSLAARGLWIECMALMHEADPYGHLNVNGQPVTDDALARLVGADPKEISALFDELEKAGVFSRNRKKTIYSRRMVSDERRVAEAKISGGEGGNPKLKRGYNKPGFIYIIGVRADGAYKIGISVNPRNRLKKIRHQYPGQDLRVLHEFPVQDMGVSESELHATFAKKGSGEWFFLDYADLCYIKENYETLKGPKKGGEKGPIKAQSPESRVQSPEYPPAPNGACPQGKPARKTNASKAPTSGIDPDWRPDAGDREYAREQGSAEDEIETMSASFVAHHTNGPGRTKRWKQYHGANGAWGTWVRNEAKFRGGGSSHAGKGNSGADRPQPGGVVAAVRRVVSH